MRAVFVALVLVSFVFGCASKPSKEALDRARETRVTQIRAAMTQTELQLGAARTRIAEAKRMKKGPDREAEIAAGERETTQYLQQKKALQAEYSVVMQELGTGEE